jgi:hydroxymethyl cephem carbamoyltransferase
VLTIALTPGHDGAAVVVEDRTLISALESEKDSFPRHETLTPQTILQALEQLDRIPDLVVLGGWWKHRFLGQPEVAAGYLDPHRHEQRSMNFCGKQVALFESSHERSHVMMAIGMAPRDSARERAVLVWEGVVGSLYLVDERWDITSVIPVMDQPGHRYAAVFALADPSFPDEPRVPRMDDAGKLMALAAFGDAANADDGVVETVERLLTAPSLWPLPKHRYRDSALYNVGVEAQATKDAAALITDRIFEVFAKAAAEHLPSDIPLHISGGCGLNCDWNVKWRDLGQFSSVFVPPCTNDSGVGVGHAIDAIVSATGDPFIDWDVYCGGQFEWDRQPDAAVWARRPLDNVAVAEALAGGRIFAWVQGRWELGPRALGNRSILAEPSQTATRDRLNEIKQRETYRPIAPCCRLEDAGKVFDSGLPDPYMLYFRHVVSEDLAAVTHVDGTARCQTVTEAENKPLHDLLSAFAERRGVGVLCNTSLNFKRLGFINRMSDLVKYCETRGLDDMVVGDAWFERVE